jgi:hypothetical protein
MSHTVLLHVNLDVMLPVAMEIAWAAPGLVSAAPLLLGAGPSVEPVPGAVLRGRFLGPFFGASS